MFRILIVDDSVFSQKITGNFIKDLLGDVEIFFAGNGKEGFEKYKEINPDYVLVDLLMPIIDGKELVKLIKEYDSNSKIMVISADVQVAIKEELELLNIMAFINKPMTKEKALAICNMIKEDANE